MCGIAGNVSMRSASVPAVEAMMRCMVPRGPDASGVWSGDGCVLGHRRLKIIDLTATGAQPMSDESGRFAVSFNGEIFNFRRLRGELESKGHAFRGTSDTEVLLRGYIEWGDALPARLEGMFAFAVWDNVERRLFAARDRYGKKPFYYIARDDGLLFASELRALLRGCERLPSISPEGLATYMRFGYVPGTASVYEGAMKIAPGHALVWEGGKAEVRAFATWPPAKPEGPAMTECEMLGQLDCLLREAVADRLVSDVPLGCFLSGGIDSSLVVAMARELAGPGLRTFNVSFPGTSRDEASYAGSVARALDTQHTRIDIAESEMESSYLETLRLATEPLGDDSFIPTYFISRAAREHVTVALSGDGGDELFGGYPSYSQIRLAGALHGPASLLPRRLGKVLPDSLAKALELFQIPSAAERALWLGSLWKEEELRALLVRPASAESGRKRFLEQWEMCGGRCLQDQFSLVDIANYLESDILTKVDRASMAASLEVRSPLLDERIFDFTARTGLRCTPLGRKKRALRELLARHVDPRMFEGPKRGFGLPINEWFRGGLRPVLEEYTSSARIRSGGLLDPGYVARMRDLHLSGRRNYGRKLHALVAWEVWRESCGA